MLFLIVFTINVGTGTCFIYYKYMNCDKKKMMLNMILFIKQQFNELINGVSQRNKHQKSNLLFFNDMINIVDFASNLLKIDKKSYKNINIYYIGYITIKKNR